MHSSLNRHFNTDIFDKIEVYFNTDIFDKIEVYFNRNCLSAVFATPDGKEYS